jgi:hypothetical protein
MVVIEIMMRADKICKSYRIYLPTMLNENILYNEDHQIAICVPCEKGLPDDTWQHFKRNHRDISLATRRIIVEQVQNLPRLPAENVQSPLEEVDAIEGIEIIPGFKCIANETCNEVCGKLGSIQEHCRDKHGWSKKRRKTPTDFKKYLLYSNSMDSTEGPNNIRGAKRQVFSRP